MLFNTLAYAQFLAIVFAVGWLLVDRRLALLLPWIALAGYAGTHPTVSSLGLTAIALAFTLGLVRRAPRGDEAARPPPPHPRLVVAALVIGLVPLGFLTLGREGLDPISYGLGLLGVPVETLGVGTWVLGALGVLAGYLLLAAAKVRLLFILGASYVFYAHWDYRFLPLIWASSTADWWLARAIHGARSARSRKLWLVGTVVMNLGVLGFFKYFNFGVDSLAAALGAFGLDAPEVTLRVALPVGISFFTFESMSYVIDVYRGELEPQKSYAEYLSFVAFFPHLVAGPIVRPKDLLPQLAGKPRFSSLEASEGLFLIALGLGKKIAIGDYLALNLVDRVFDAPLMYSSVEVYAGILGYALQIYCDFSGYTDIAIGSALLLGVRFPLNFNSPYKAHDIVDFWRRWHISLSTWLRDYLYIPLGGNRKGRGRTYFNLMATMVLGGLWHGAAWTFVAWGALHGAALAVNKWFENRRHERRRHVEALPTAPGPGGPSPEAHQAAKPLPKPRPPGGFRLAVQVFVTFHFVCACWVFFRAESFPAAQLVFTQLAQLTTHTPNLAPSILVVLAVGLLGHYVPESWFQTGLSRFVRLPGWAQGLGLFLVALVLRRMASTDSVPFVYFQF